MTPLDTIILVILGLGVLLGLLKGALKQLAGLLGLVVGLLAAKALYATVAEEVFSHVTGNMTVAQMLSFLAIWVVVPLLFWVVACMLTKAMDAVCLGWVNRLLGGVLGGVVSALTSFAAPGDAVLVHSPTYIGFTHALEDNGYRIVHSPLVRDAEGVWRMDYADMDAKLKAHRIHVAVFCEGPLPKGSGPSVV